MTIKLLKISILLTVWNFLYCTLEPEIAIKSNMALPPVIQAFFNTTADTQYVVLSTIMPGATTDSQHFMNIEVPMIRDAQVWFADETKSFTFTPIYIENINDRWALAEGFYRYWASTEPILPGQQYWLKVTIPGKGEFTASTTAPGDFEILSPNSTDTIDVFQPIEVKWTTAEGAAGYRIDLWEFEESRNEYINREWIGWNNSFRGVFVETIPDTVLQFQHILAHYYEPSRDSTQSNYLYRAVLTIDALDEPAWTAYCLEKNKHDAESDFRIETVAYSNIAGGRGLMTASTSKYVELLLPKGQK
ncbi:DUF4249 family protein [candidate division KSB1 bacterium]|nr:DUF4249 family protein [candidate division KSB1 bacterium]